MTMKVAFIITDGDEDTKPDPSVLRKIMAEGPAVEAIRIGPLREELPKPAQVCPSVLFFGGLIIADESGSINPVLPVDLVGSRRCRRGMA